MKWNVLSVWTCQDELRLHFYGCNACTGMNTQSIIAISDGPASPQLHDVQLHHSET
jgi:hypothetical protein